jgi:hypothetical protein
MVHIADHNAARYVIFCTPLIPRPLMANYLPQNPILEQPFPLFLFQCQRYVSHPYQTTGTITVLCILMFIFLDIKLQDVRYCVS